MTKTQKLVLIDGTFSNDEATGILLNIFYSKISFHHSRNFSSQERFGKDDETAQKRIPALKKELSKLQDILAEAKANNKKLVVSSEIKISFSDDL